MKVINTVLYTLVIIVKGLFIILQVSVILVYALVVRRKSGRAFERELSNNGLPPEAISELGCSYKDMVSLNVFSYRNKNKNMNRAR